MPPAHSEPASAHSRARAILQELLRAPREASGCSRAESDARGERPAAAPSQWRPAVGGVPRRPAEAPRPPRSRLAGDERRAAAAAGDIAGPPLASAAARRPPGAAPAGCQRPPGHRAPRQRVDVELVGALRCLRVCAGACGCEQAGASSATPLSPSGVRRASRRRPRSAGQAGRPCERRRRESERLPTAFSAREIHF